MKIEIGGSLSEEEKDCGSKNDNKKASESELRQDIVTGDWVIIATGRAKRPEDFSQNHRQKTANGGECFFCDPEKSGQEKDTLIYRREGGEWTLRVFPNKYPAFTRGRVPRSIGEGPYFAMTGTGYHEVVVTRDHDRHIPQLETGELAELFDSYQDRYLDLMNRKSVNYITIFHNYGSEAGASIAHPHSQLMAIPVISPYIKLELDGSETYYRSNRSCAFCTIAEYEKENQKRVVAENDQFIAFCPYSSRAAFEIWVMPKKHSPYFERITNEEKLKLADVFRMAMVKLHKALNDPPFNFYIHTAPCDGKDYPHYHWHIEILPHTATWAGFELQTGIEISTIQPEVAAEYLKRMTV